MRALLALILVVIYCSMSSRAVEQPELEFLVTYFRHGDRTAIHVPPKGFKYDWKESKGFLTMKGIQQAVELGTTLGQLYIKEKKFLSPVFEEAIKQIYVQSSDYSRTLQTANAVLHGMFSDHLESSYLPIMIHSKLQREDLVLKGLDNCNNALEYKRQIALQSHKFRQLAKDNATLELSEKLSKLFGFNEAVPLINWHEKFYDPIFCANQHNISRFIEGLTEEEIQKTISIGNQVWDIFFTANENYLSQIAAANIFADFKTKLDGYLASPSNPKWVIYSAHDTTLLPILGSLGLNDSTSVIPGYTSVINFEVTKFNGSRYVNVYYNGKLKSPSCFSLFSKDKTKYGCPLPHFYALYCTDSKQPWMDNCQNSDPDEEETCDPFANSFSVIEQKKITFTPFFVVFTILGFVVGFSMFYFVLLRLFRTKKGRKFINLDVEIENEEEDNL